MPSTRAGGAPIRDASRAHPGTVGWWLPPKASARAQGTRHRVGAPNPPPRRRRLLRRVLFGVGAGVVLAPAAAFVVGYVLLPVPTPEAAVHRQLAVLSYADGSTLGGLIPGQPDRSDVAIEAVPLAVREAVLAVEDHSPTLTERFLDIALGDDPSPWARYRKFVVSVKTARERSADQILGDYLNAAYFGRGAYGIEAASRAYFGKHVASLTVAEGALLAGTLAGPAQADPAVSPDHGVARWNTVLDAMLARGSLTPARRAGLTIPATLPRGSGPDGGPATADGHLAAAVAAELAEIGITEQDVAQGGLRVTTTLDPTRQRQVVAAARAGPAGSGSDAALVALDPASGGVLAYYGGEGYADEVRVAGPAGVTFTPFTVLAGLSGDAAVGPQSVADAARTAGLPVDGSDPAGDPLLTPVDLASAYATIAADGVWHRPHLVATVSTANGRVLYHASADGGRRFSPDAAHRAAAPLLDVAAHRGVGLLDGSRVALVTDGATTAGFTPSVVVVVRWAPGQEPSSGRAPSRSEAAWRAVVAAPDLPPCTLLSPCG